MENLLGTQGEIALQEFIAGKCSGNKRKARVIELKRHSNGDISGRFYNRSRDVWKKKIFNKTIKIVKFDHSTTLHFHGSPKATADGGQIFLSNGNDVYSNHLARLVGKALM